MKQQCYCNSPEDKRYGDAVDALLNNGMVDLAVRRAFFEYVDGELTDDEMEYLVGGNGRLSASMRPEVRERYGYDE